MYQLIESICIIDGEIRNLNHHQTRMNQALNDLFQRKTEINLMQILQNYEIPTKGKFKCRIEYTQEIEKVEFLAYSVKQMNTFELAREDSLAYSYKFAERNQFNKLKSKSSADELILVKNDKITDTTFSNLIFFDGENWFTPKTFLLNGIMRQFLLQNCKIQEISISPKDLKQFQFFKMINAMMNLEESPTYRIQQIQNLEIFI